MSGVEARAPVAADRKKPAPLDVASDEPAERNDDRPLASCGGLGMNVDGRAFTTEEAEDYASSKLIELTPDGFQERAKLRGVVGNIARLR